MKERFRSKPQPQPEAPVKPVTQRWHSMTGKDEYDKPKGRKAVALVFNQPKTKFSETLSRVRKDLPPDEGWDLPKKTEEIKVPMEMVEDVKEAKKLWDFSKEKEGLVEFKDHAIELLAKAAGYYLNNIRKADPGRSVNMLQDFSKWCSSFGLEGEQYNGLITHGLIKACINYPMDEEDLKMAS